MTCTYKLPEYDGVGSRLTRPAFEAKSFLTKQAAATSKNDFFI